MQFVIKRPQISLDSTSNYGRTKFNWSGLPQLHVGSSSKSQGSSARGDARSLLCNEALPVAEGSFSLVYKLDLCVTHYTSPSVCSCQKPRVQVACKTLRTNNETERQQLDTEFQALTLLQQFSHPHIINLIGSYHLEDGWGIVLPMAQCDLDAYMSLDGPLPSWTLTTWVLGQITGIASALSLIHGLKELERWGVHGDIKPSNILILQNLPDLKNSSQFDQCGRWVLSDFGLSHFTESHEPKSLQESDMSPIVHWNLRTEILGDRQYIAPETEIEHESSPASDIWSFGCVLLEVLVWLSYGKPGRQGLLRELGSDDGSQRHPFWITTESSRVTLKPAILAWIDRLEKRIKGNDVLFPAVKLLRSGHILDPDPRKRTTAAALAEKLEQSSQHASVSEEDSDKSDDLFGAHYHHEATKADPPTKEDLFFDHLDGNKWFNAAFAKTDQSLISEKVVGSETYETDVLNLRTPLASAAPTKRPKVPSKLRAVLAMLKHLSYRRN